MITKIQSLRDDARANGCLTDQHQSDGSLASGNDDGTSVPLLNAYLKAIAMVDSFSSSSVVERPSLEAVDSG